MKYKLEESCMARNKRDTNPVTLRMKYFRSQSTNLLCQVALEDIRGYLSNTNIIAKPNICLYRNIRIGALLFSSL